MFVELQSRANFEIAPEGGAAVQLDVSTGSSDARGPVQRRHYCIQASDRALVIEAGMPRAEIYPQAEWYRSDEDTDPRWLSMAPIESPIRSAIEAMAKPTRDRRLAEMIRRLLPGSGEGVEVASSRDSGRVSVTLRSPEPSPFLSPEVGAAIRIAVARATDVPPAVVRVEITGMQVVTVPERYATITREIAALKGELVRADGSVNMTRVLIESEAALRSLQLATAPHEPVAADGSFRIASEWIYEPVAERGPRERYRVVIAGRLDAQRPGETAIALEIQLTVQHAPRAGGDENWEDVVNRSKTTFTAGVGRTTVREKITLGYAGTPENPEGNPDSLETAVRDQLAARLLRSE